MNWHVIAFRGQLHVVPVDDLREHVCHHCCWCRPHFDEDDTLVHHSLDGRECLEKQELPH